jgi:mediator of RNA polymerase II transcription subunit 17
MTTDELVQMRLNILQDLLLSARPVSGDRRSLAVCRSIAQGELSLARDLLSVLLGSPDASHLPTVPNAHPVAQPVTALPAHSIAAAVVTQPEPIPSVRAFNAQLVLGGKDESLRAAAAVLRSAATALDASQPARERYWLDALKLRRANWALIPAPPPLGAAPGPRGAERLATDFLVSFGLEECASRGPLMARRQREGSLITCTGPQSTACLPPSCRRPTANCDYVRG